MTTNYPRRGGTTTRAFGSGRRESHDSSAFYARGLAPGAFSTDTTLAEVPAGVLDRVFEHSSEDMAELPDNSVGLVVTSPPYHAGKDYDTAEPFDAYLGMLQRVLAEVHRVLEPGGRAVINVANLGRRPYVPLAARVSALAMDVGFFPRGEVIWVKAAGAAGSCAWGSWCSAANPTLRDVHEYLLCLSKGRMDRVRRGTSTISAEEFLAATTSVWHLAPESARRVGHPAPFPVALPARFIQLYSFAGDVVVDPFLGSGTTAVAAACAGRHFVGYETQPAYAALARARLAQTRAAIEAASRPPSPPEGFRP